MQVTNYEFADDIYEVSLKNFVARRIYPRAPAAKTIFAWITTGVVRGKQELEGSGKDSPHPDVTYKHPQTGKWEEHHRVYATKREGMGPVAFDNDGRRVYMVDNTGRERSVIRTTTWSPGNLGEPLYGGGEIEALNVIQATNPEDFGEIVGFVGLAPRWNGNTPNPSSAVDAEAPGGGAAGRARSTDWVAMSDDLTIIVVLSSGPREAGAYHLLVNGKDLVPLGRSFPLLEPGQMADMEFVTYKARDGLEIPAFLTVPAVR